MNEKFYDLPTEKQNRFINAAFKVFSQNGYKKASTDDIVRDAGISKGLLFHYFGSKQGLYEYVYTYGVKYICMEYSHILPEQKIDFFVLQKKITVVQKNIIQNYPYMLIFLKKAFQEQNIEVMEKIADKMDYYSEMLTEIYAHADVSAISESVDPSRLLKMCMYIAEGVMTEQFDKGTISAQAYLDENISFLEMLEHSMKISL